MRKCAISMWLMMIPLGSTKEHQTLLKLTKVLNIFWGQCAFRVIPVDFWGATHRAGPGDVQGPMYYGESNLSHTEHELQPIFEASKLLLTGL